MRDMVELERLKAELEGLKRKYTSPARMAQVLRFHPAFEKLDRTTILRWCRKVSEHQADRAALAIEILKSKQQAQTVVIGEPRTLWVLPSTMLNWPPARHTPYGLLERKYNVKMKRVETKTGGEAVELLKNGKVQIALAAREMIPVSFRLCSLVKTYLTGCGTREIKSIQDLNTLICGYLANSAVPERLSTIILRGKTRSFESMKDSAQALLLKQVDVVIGWEPLISEIMDEFTRMSGGHRTIYFINPGLLGTIDIDIAINIRSADPSAVRKYLMSLKETAKYIEKHKASDAFHTDISGKLGIEEGHIKSILANSQFTLEDFELETVLTLWEREAYA